MPSTKPDETKPVKPPRTAPKDVAIEPALDLEEVVRRVTENLRTTAGTKPEPEPEPLMAADSAPALDNPGRLFCDSPVYAALDKVGRRLDGLSHLMTSVESRLRPVLDPNKTIGATEVGDTKIRSDGNECTIEDAVRGFNLVLEEMEDRMTRLHNAIRI